MPKWEEDSHPMPAMGKLLEPESLKNLYGRAAAWFAKQDAFPVKVPLRALRLAAGS